MGDRDRGIMLCCEFQCSLNLLPTIITRTTFSVLNCIIAGTPVHPALIHNEWKQRIRLIALIIPSLLVQDKNMCRFRVGLHIWPGICPVPVSRYMPTLSGTQLTLIQHQPALNRHSSSTCLYRSGTGQPLHADTCRHYADTGLVPALCQVSVIDILLFSKLVQCRKKNSNIQ